MTIEVTRSLRIPDAELTERFTTSGGPGGQHANKAATRVELTWNIEGSKVLSEEQRAALLERFGPVIRVVVDDERSQRRNRELAEERLIARLRSALTPPKARRRTRPTAGSQRRRLEQKRRASKKKQLRRRPRPDD